MLLNRLNRLSDELQNELCHDEQTNNILTTDLSKTTFSTFDQMCLIYYVKAMRTPHIRILNRKSMRCLQKQQSKPYLMKSYSSFKTNLLNQLS